MVNDLTQILLSAMQLLFILSLNQAWKMHIIACDKTRTNLQIMYVLKEFAELFQFHFKATA